IFMASSTKRDPVADHLITPQNAALLLIDYQPSQIAAVRSMDPQLMLKNAVSTVKLAKTFGLPLVHSTVNVASGRQKPTVPELLKVLDGAVAIDRTTINSWEDPDFVDAIGGTSVEAHRAGLKRVAQAGAAPITWVSLACELQRDWARTETVAEVVQIVLTE